MENLDLTLQWSKLIPFTNDAIKPLLNGIEGVYRISRKEPDDKFYVVFIGSSPDLGDELSKKLSESIFIKQDGNFAFRYASIKGEEKRKAIEKQMYKQYAPQFNQTEPQSSLDIKVNLN